MAHTRSRRHADVGQVATAGRPGGGRGKVKRPLMVALSVLGEALGARRGARCKAAHHGAVSEIGTQLTSAGTLSAACHAEAATIRANK